MSISGVGGAANYTPPVRTQAPPRPPVPTAAPIAVGGRDADGDHDGTKGASLDVRV
jgi:hypothetical protein